MLARALCSRCDRGRRGTKARHNLVDGSFVARVQNLEMPSSDAEKLNGKGESNNGRSDDEIDAIRETRKCLANIAKTSRVQCLGLLWRNVTFKLIDKLRNLTRHIISEYVYFCIIAHG
ncbi:hypothetical protein HN011_001293 [Eciton burchellii]|nr:hypothetical protein HN011_001293 [Eciton burchellii]